MSDRFFLDTNVFAYSFDDPATRKQVVAIELIRKALDSHKGVVSFQVVQEFFNLALRKFAQPLRTIEAEQYLATVFHPMLAVHSSASLYREALRLQSETRFSWYDSLILCAAQQAECKVLYSEDLQHGRKIGSLEIINPFL